MFCWVELGLVKDFLPHVPEDVAALGKAALADPVAVGVRGAHVHVCASDLRRRHQGQRN